MTDLHKFAMYEMQIKLEQNNKNNCGGKKCGEKIIKTNMSVSVTDCDDCTCNHNALGLNF